MARRDRASDRGGAAVGDPLPGAPPPADHDEHGRPVAPGGWRRIVIGLLIGLLAGAAVAFAMPRDDGPRRRSLLDELDGDDLATGRRGGDTGGGDLGAGDDRDHRGHDSDDVRDHG